MSETTVSEATATAEETNEEPVVTQRLTLAQRRRLLRPLNPQRVKKNPKGFSYIPHNDSRAELIKTFGLCGYDLETLSLEQVSARVTESKYKNDDGSPKYVYSYVFRATVRLTVKDEHGNPLAVLAASGAGGSTNLPSEPDAVDNAIKGAESEAFKRCVMNLGDQYGLSLYDHGALESVGGSLVDSPAIQAASPQTAPAPAAPAEQPGPAQRPAPPKVADDTYEVLAKAIKTVQGGDALTGVATRVQNAHVHRIITDEQRAKLLESGAARRKELAEAAPSR